MRTSLKEAIHLNRKRAATKRREEWNRALTEGRVVRFGETSFTAYLTVAEAVAAVAENPEHSQIVTFVPLQFGE